MNGGEANAQAFETIEAYIQGLKSLSNDSQSNLFFRGHSKDIYKLQPSLLRDTNLRNNERNLLLTLVSEAPGEFEGDRFAFEQLVRAQHYGLPTRLLDLTSNPLMGLYFACSSNDRASGQVLAINAARAQIKFFESDSVSCKANLAYLTSEEHAELIGEVSSGPDSLMVKARR